MTWNIADAKQRFSEVVKQAVAEPQVIYNRSQPVAVIVNAQEFEAFQAWRRSQAQPKSLAEEFAEVRAMLASAGLDEGLDTALRTDRANAFEALLDEEQ